MKRNSLILLAVVAAALLYFFVFRKKTTAGTQPSSGAAPHPSTTPPPSRPAQASSDLGTEINQYSNDVTVVGDAVQSVTGSSVGDWLGLGSASKGSPPTDSGGTSGGDNSGTASSDL